MTEIGLLGGTFDPVHNGHMQLARAGLEDGGLDQVLFIPASRPPHKRSSAVCDITHRLQMLQTAMRHEPRFHVSEIECSADKVSYTFDTLEMLRQKYPGSTTLHFIIGQDAFLEIETWYRWKDVLSTTNFIIAPRSGHTPEDIKTLLARNDFRPDSRKKRVWQRPHGLNSVLFLSSSLAEISSTDIRNRIQKNVPWRDLVPDDVVSYIDKFALYT